jgi:hypothetical protein
MIDNLVVPSFGDRGNSSMAQRADAVQSASRDAGSDRSLGIEISMLDARKLGRETCAILSAKRKIAFARSRASLRSARIICAE